MKTLILIFITVMGISSCIGNSKENERKEKDFIAIFANPILNGIKSTSLTDDQKAQISNAQKIAYVKGLPLVDVSAYDSTSLKALGLDGVIESVEIPDDGKPYVKFYVASKTTSSLAASRLKGFGWTTKRTTIATNKFASNITYVSNINFTIAKYVEGTNGGPGKWVNYIVTTPEVTAGSDGTTTYTRQLAFSVPTNDNEGTITDNGDGSYNYKFSRNIKTSANYIGQTYGESRTTLYTKTSTLSTVSSTKQANLGDLTYNSSLPHRVIVYLGAGYVRGTSSNNSDGTDTSTGVSSVSFDGRETLAFDFIPATNQIKALQKDVTTTTTCNNCHKSAGSTSTTGITEIGLIFHGGGGRNDVRHCVMCHTDQMRASSDTDHISSTSTGAYSASSKYYIYDGYNVIDFPVMIHKFHMSSKLVKSGNYYAVSTSYAFLTKAANFWNLANSKLCYNCHTTNKTTTNEDNWKTKPTRIACGSCHDGVNFNTGVMYKSVKSGVTDVTHGGGKQLDDSKCANCHTTSDITSKHGL